MEPTEIPTENNFNTFEEYKLLVEDTARMTDRRQNNNTLYLTINTTLLAGLLIILENSNAQSAPQTGTEAAVTKIGSILPTGGIIEPQWVIFALAISLFFAAIGLNLTWRRMIAKYKGLIALRFKILEEMEFLSGMQGSVQVYRREYEEFYAPRSEDDKSGKGKKKLSFSKMEMYLPTIFIGLYILLAGLLTLAMIPK